MNAAFIRISPLNDIILSGNFDFRHSLLLKDNIATFVGFYPKSRFGDKMTEKEVEENGWIAELKKENFTKEDVERVVLDILKRVDIDEIDHITFTPDSGNEACVEKKTLKGFSVFVSAIAKSLNKSIVLPEITRAMEKQKNQSVDNRVSNRRGAYSFKEKVVNGKKILFIDDVITTGATVLSMGEDIANKGGIIYAYGIAQSELDGDKKTPIDRVFTY